MERKKRNFTLMLIPDGGGQLRQVKVSDRRRRFVIGFVLSFVGVSMLSLGFSIVAALNLPEYIALKRQNAENQQQIAQLGYNIDGLTQSMDRMRQFNRKMRILLGNDQPVADNDDLFGVGGPGEPNADGYLLRSNKHISPAMLSDRIEDLELSAELEETEMEQLHGLMQSQSSRLASTPSIWPTRGWLTSTFGHRTSPFTGMRRRHEGMDVASRIGAPVVVSADGTVLFAGFNGDYGKMVIVDHGYGVSTRYAHLSRIHARAGQKIGRGDRIGEVGSTGRSTGPHLHYEVRVNGVPVDPMRYILVD